MNTITMNTKPSTEVDGAGNIHSNTGDTDNSSSSTTGEEHFFQPKYLTNSRLFRLQLKDPILRVCMLTQFLILLNTLSKVKAPEGTQTSKNQLEEIEQRVIRLLEQTPLDGQGASRMIQTVLERERNWTKWKADKCPPYEKFHHQVRPQLSPSSTNDGSTNTKKRKITDIDSSTSNGAVAIDTDGVIKTKRARQSGGTGGFGGTARGVNKRNSIALMDQILLESTASEDILKKLKANDRITAVPLKKYMARFTEAWDPENGIEKEYWPDKDKMFCWRTVRTCMKEKINFLELSVDGASAIVRGILKLPVEKIEIQKESEEVNEEQEEEQEEQEEGQIQEKLKEEQKETSNK
jgi:THO complex subunit 1